MKIEGMKDFYTTMELIAEPWFPVRSTVTLKKLIEAEKIKAINISTSEKHLTRYRIQKQSIIDFMEKELKEKIEIK